MTLVGKRAFITGSSTGIGFATARQMLELGASVVLTSEKPLESCPDVSALLNRFPHTAKYFVANILKDDLEALVESAWSTFGGIDVLVNNVGTFREPLLLELSRTDFDFIFGMNVWTALAITQGVVRRAKSVGRGGRILFTTSLNGSRSEPGHTLYDASKGAIDALTRQLAVELAPLGFTTAAVAPGLVETPLTDFGLQSDPEVRTAILQQIPIRRIATADEIAAWFAFLASDAAHYATGIVIPVDGGLNAQQMSRRPLATSEKV